MNYRLACENPRGRRKVPSIQKDYLVPEMADGVYLEEREKDSGWIEACE
jgi:hypothetical protein